MAFKIRSQFEFQLWYSLIKFSCCESVSPPMVLKVISAPHDCCKDKM